jgi:hypothetical protein
MSMSFEVSKCEKTLLFLSWLKNFNCVAKDAVLHLKSGDNSNFHPFKTHPKSPCLTYYKLSVVEMKRF